MTTATPNPTPGSPLRPVGSAEADFRQAQLEARSSLRETRRLIEERRAREASSIIDTWARSTTRRRAQGGDLHRRPLTRAEMTAPLAWHEEQLARPRRFGELADGTIGYEDVGRLRGGAR